MLLRSGGARDLRIRDVPHEQMAEGVLALLANGRTTIAAHELLTLEPVQEELGFLPVASSDLAQRPEPEDLPDHGRVLEQELFLDRERIEARRDQSLHGLR